MLPAPDMVADVFTQGQLESYARRALNVIGSLPANSLPTDEIERLYHQLVVEPEYGADTLEATWLVWHNAGRHEALDLLASTLEELLPLLSIPARATALLLHAKMRRSSLSASQILAQATLADQLFERLAQRRRQAQALELMGDTHVTLGQLQKSHEFHHRCLKLRQDLLCVDATVSQWQRDLSVSFERLWLRRT